MLDSHGPDAPRLAVQEAIVEHHYRDHVFAVFDPSGGMLASSQDLPNQESPPKLFSSGSFLELRGKRGEPGPALWKCQRRARRLSRRGPEVYIEGPALHIGAPAVTAPAKTKCWKKYA